MCVCVCVFACTYITDCIRISLHSVFRCRLFPRLTPASLSILLQLNHALRPAVAGATEPQTSPPLPPPLRAQPPRSLRNRPQAKCLQVKTNLHISTPVVRSPIPIPRSPIPVIRNQIPPMGLDKLLSGFLRDTKTLRQLARGGKEAAGKLLHHCKAIAARTSRKMQWLTVCPVTPEAQTSNWKIRRTLSCLMGGQEWR